MAKINPIQVQKFLGGIDYPAEKQHIVDHATEQGADDDIRDALERLPMDRFESPSEVSEALGRLGD